MKLFCSRLAKLGVFLILPLCALPVRAAVLINEVMYHPSSENILEEYIELFNSGPASEPLAGWHCSKGVQFTFPNVTLAPGGFLVVAADLATFTNKYPGLTNVIGNWTGRLSNSDEEIELRNALNSVVDTVAYADEGDWALRQRGPLDHGHHGWLWFAAHDGGGQSLELINPILSNQHGQNWASSLTAQGTPGRANSVTRTNIAPLILEVRHLPAVPRSVDAVLVSARLVDERSSNLTAALSWRLDSASGTFNTAPMFDDGLHSDGAAGDGVFGVSIPPQTNNAVVEFYLTAADPENLSRTWPAPALETNGIVLGPVANALYQVDDSAYTGSHPLYKLIMKEVNRIELAAIGAPNSSDRNSDAQMNSTFISMDGTGSEVRYLAGVRNRGHGSRNRLPNNHRVNFTSDGKWKNVSAINLNSQYTHAQLIGAVLSLKSGVGGGDSLPVQVRVNNQTLANNGPQTYGGIYVANEVVNSDWAEHWFPADNSGNLYRALRDLLPSDFAYRGTNHTAYTNTWFKQSNTSENDWSDLISMLRIVGTNDLFATQAVRSVANVEQWMTYLAVMALLNVQETSPGRGYNDDYILYAGANDTRFQLMYYDLDSILGEGDTPGSTTGTIFGAKGLPAFKRFLEWPEFEPIYYRTLQHLLETTFSKSEFELTIDQTLGGFVPANVIARIKTWMDGRRDHVQSLIAPYLAINGIPAIASVSNTPRSPTPLTSANLIVTGEGVTHYRYSLNGSPFGVTSAVALPITLNNLPHGGTNTIRVIGIGANGVWQSESNATSSATWIVNTNWPAVRINEVLARNVAALNHQGTFPDIIELYNEGSAPADLSGLRLTDNAASPNKYSFPNGTMLDAGNHLVLFAGNSDGTPGIHTGFALSQDGEGVFLFDSVARGGALLDAVQFGLQLPDLSIGRISGGGEFVLTQPTLGTNNVAQPLGTLAGLKINEWLASELVASTTDFVELFNTNPQPVALGGLYFTDNPIGEPFKSAVTPLSFIAGRGFRSFKADGDPQQGFDHLNLKLAAEQGLIALLRPDREVIDIVLYGPQRTDVSQGRTPDGGNVIHSFSTPTPGALNPSPLACTITAANLSLMNFSHVWKYNQTTNLDGVLWQGTNYSDATWPSGPGLLAFENNSTLNSLIQTPLASPESPAPGLTSGHAYYFRTTLNLTNHLAAYTISATAYLDDGAIVYVNGQEVSPRIRMPGGTVTNASLASGTPSGGDATSPDLFVIPASLFQLGTNVIAVEVHQNSTGSSDVVWGLALSASAQFVNCAPASVVLNEVLASNQSFTNGAGRTPDWIELRNTTTNALDLADFSLTDAISVPRKWVFPPGSAMAPGAQFVVECDDSQPVSATNTGFNLSAQSGAVFLFERPADGGTVHDALYYGLQASDFSIGRTEEASNYWTLALPTRGAPNVAAGLGNASSLKINEWLANPANGEDWLELHNPAPQPVALSALALTDNAAAHNQSPFPPLSFLGPLGYQKIIADGNQGAGANHADFKLAAEGGFIGLFWPVGTQIDAVSFGPQTTDVSAGRFPDATASFVNFNQSASPGAPNYLPFTNLFINEVLSHTDSPLEDAVEIFNGSGNPINLGGWFLSNDELNLKKFRLPTDTIIPAFGFVTLYQYQFGAGGLPMAFTFSSAHGDAVHLAQADTAGNLSGYRARVAFGAATNGVSFGRFLTRVGEEFVPMSRRSFGQDNPTTLTQFRSGLGVTNPYPLVGPVVFSEIHYQPTNDYLGDIHAGEFLELLNFSSNAVPLFDPAAATNRWRIAGGVNFTIPSNLTLAAGASLLIVGFDPAANLVELDWFRNAYHLSATQTVYGPWSGSLADASEGIQLLKPDPPQTATSPDAGFVPYVLVENVRYRTSSPWATNGIGAGASLQRLVPARFGNEPLNWFAATPTPGLSSLADSDGDSLPDYWELQFGLSPTNASGTHGFTGDRDSDGQSNGQEFLGGTDPSDSADQLRLNVALEGNSLNLQFQAAANRSYSVLFSATSPNGPWLKLADAPTSANTRSVVILDTTPESGARFYRLVAPASAP